MKLRLSQLEQKIFDFAKSMCEWRLGREQLYQTTEDGKEALFEDEPPPKTVDEIIACLKRTRKSIKFWAKQGGRKGYLTFIDDFFLW